MDSFLVAVVAPPSRSAPDPLVEALADCTRRSRRGVLVVVEGLGPGAPPAARMLVVEEGALCDGTPRRALLLAAPCDDAEQQRLTGWLAEGGNDLVDLPLALSRLLLDVTTAAPRTRVPTGPARPSSRG